MARKCISLQDGKTKPYELLGFYAALLSTRAFVLDQFDPGSDYYASIRPLITMVESLVASLANETTDYTDQKDSK